VKRVSQYVALVAYVVFLAFPLLWLLSTALKTPQEMALTDPTWIPREPTLANFGDAFGEQDLLGASLRSLVVALFASVITVLISLPAAYAMARHRSLINKIAIGWVLVSQVFPFILIIIPLFIVLRNIGLLDSLFGLIVIYSVWSLPFALWMLQGYIGGIPPELEEAGAMDGASRPRILRAIVLPLLMPGLVATSLFTFISSWNEFFFALVLIQSPELQTLPLTLARFVGAEGQVQLGQLAAGSLLATIPSLVFFAIIQKRLTSGLLSGAVKG
jgi:multiple sugar transport system permease protein